MTDEPIVTETLTSNDNSQVSKPFVSAKPYDDDMLEAYESEESSGEVQEESPEVVEETETKVASPEAKATSKDQVDDGFEKVVIEKEINGKPFKFTVADAIKAKVTHEEAMRNIDRRATFLKQKEQAWDADVGTFKSRAQNVIAAAQKGDFVSAIRALAKLGANASDLDIVDLEDQYFDQLEKIESIRSKMTPEEKRAFKAERAAAAAKAENQKYIEKVQQAKARSELQVRVSQLMEQHKIPEQEFWGNYKTLIENHVGEGKKFSSNQEVTAEEVVAYSNEVKDWTKVFEASEKTGVEDESILEELKKIATLNPDYTSEDLVKIVDKAGFIAKTADSTTVENLNRKAGKSRLAQQGTATKKQNGKLEGYDEESIEFLYRNQPKTYQRPQR